MATFRYRALNSAGRTLRGKLTAVNETDLFYRLKQAGLDLIDATQVTENRLAAYFAKPISTRDLVELCIHLEQLEKVGVPILDSLSDIREATESIRLRDVLTDVVRDVSNGRLLSEALAIHPKVFNEIFVGLVAAGERTGNMSDSFGQLVRHLKWADDMNRRISGAVRYPVFILAVTIGMLFALMIFLVPELSGFLKSIDMELPTMTIALIAVSEFLQVYWWLVLGLPIVLGVVGRLLYQLNDQIAYYADQYAYRLPLVGMVMKKLAVSRFTHFFAIMYSSGIGVLECIDGASRVVPNRALKSSLAVVRKMVEGGSSLTAALQSSGEFPSLVIRMVKIGEETGNLRDTLENVSYFYDRDVNESIDAMIAGVQPMLTMVIGLTMVWIIIAVIGPVYDSFSNLPL